MGFGGDVDVEKDDRANRRGLAVMVVGGTELFDCFWCLQDAYILFNTNKKKSK